VLVGYVVPYVAFDGAWGSNRTRPPRESHVQSRRRTSTAQSADSMLKRVWRAGPTRGLAGTGAAHLHWYGLN
jgi:hypothetical protein